MKTIALFFAAAALNLTLSGQINKFGVPFIRNYDILETKGSEQNWCITKDKFGNIYFGSQDRGVAKYDGTAWSLIRIGVNPRIYSLASDSSGIVYVGAAFEFGYIQPGKNGLPQYVSLAERIDSIPEIRNIFSVTVHKGKVHFLSSKFIYSYDIGSDSLTKTDLSAHDFIVPVRLTVINEMLIIADNIKGIFRWKENKFVPLPGSEFFKTKICIVLLPYDDDNMIVGTFYDGLFLYNYKTGTVRSDFIDEQLNDSLKIASIYTGARTDENTFVIGTTSREGLLVFNRSGRLTGQLNKGNSDLQDNQIMAMYFDAATGELWLSAFGVISKIYFNIPVTKFAEKQGITAPVNEICRFGGNLYVSSDEGIFKSHQDERKNAFFIKLKGINTQVFPLKVIRAPSGDFMIAGSLDGTLQLSRDGSFIKIERNCSNLPRENIIMDVRKILQSEADPKRIYFGLSSGGIVIMTFEGEKWTYRNKISGFPGNISGIVEDKDGSLWFLTDDPAGLYNCTLKGKELMPVRYGKDKGIPDADLNSIEVINGELYLCTAEGILKHNRTAGNFITADALTMNYSVRRNSLILYRDKDGDTWYSGIDKKNFESLILKDSTIYEGMLNLLPDVPSLDIKNYDGKVYFLKSKSIYIVDKAKLKPDTSKVNTMFTTISIGSDSLVMNGSFYRELDTLHRMPVLLSSAEIPQFPYDLNDISFEWTTPSYIEEFSTRYSYRLEGFDEKWSEWDQPSPGRYFSKSYTNLPYGRYSFRVRTKTVSGQNGEGLVYDFMIKKPWYATILAISGFILTSFLLIYLVIKAYTRKLRNENIRLEGIVAERTAVVVKQKEELESSIHYASRIQMALLPSENILSENIRNYFVLFRPRDIVSGDFYWLTKKGERLYIVAADCTGHGVPGAFMSLLGMSFLDEIIDKDNSPASDTVLKKLRLHVIESLKQAGEDGETKDGMDISLLVLDFEKRKIEFSGAYNPCFRVRKLQEGELKSYSGNGNEIADGSESDGKYLLETINADKMPIGISPRMNENFTCCEYPLEKGFSYYLFSDGYIDQFGGPNGKKFMKKNFKKLLLDIQDHPMEVQKEMLDRNIDDWRGPIEQIDDILVMGIRID